MPDVFGEFHRTLAPGGYLLWGDYVGDERLQPTQGYGHPVSYEPYLLPLNRMIGLLEQAGLVVTGRLEQEPGGRVNRRPVARGCVADVSDLVASGTWTRCSSGSTGVEVPVAGR